MKCTVRQCVRQLYGVVANMHETLVSVAMALFRRLPPLSSSTATSYNVPFNIWSIQKPFQGFINQNMPFSLYSSCFHPGR
jgi:hypothetical protein